MSNYTSKWVREACRAMKEGEDPAILCVDKMLDAYSKLLEEQETVTNCAGVSSKLVGHKGEREAFEKWVSEQSWFKATLGLMRTHDAYTDPCINSRWQGWQARAHLAQPAQAVDVGAILELACQFKNDEFGVDEFQEKLTRALTGEKAGLVGDGLPLTNTFVQEVPDKCDRIIWRGRYYHLHEGHSPASPAPDKEG